MTVSPIHPLGLVASCFAVAFGFGLGFGYFHSIRHGKGTTEALLAGVEMGLLICLGAFAARVFIWALLALANFSQAATYAVGWLFLIWPGVIDTIAWLFTRKTVFQPTHLIELATIVGGLIGFADGFRRIHCWNKWGGLTFLADVTWGLANNFNAVFIHIVNLGWGQPIATERMGAHCYDRGFCFAPPFALTQGNVCSNMRGRFETNLFAHEYVHVTQNRVFGPVFPLTYVGWMIVMLIPAAIYGIYVGRVGDTVMSWCYYNNPWEEWAYRVGGGRYPELVWPIKRTLILGSIFFFLVFAFLGWIILQVWIP